MLVRRADRMEQKSNVRGIFPWMEILQVLLPLIGSCKKPVNPAPPNPTPNPTPAQADAWAKAWHLKSAAMDNYDGEEYRPATINKTAAPIRQQKRRDNGKKISKDDARAAAIVALDDARTSELDDLYHDVLEAQA